MPCCPRDRVDASHLEEPSQLGYLGILDAHVENPLPWVLGPEGRELGTHATAHKCRRDIPHVESVGLPHQLPGELREPELPKIDINTEERTDDLPVQVVPILELVERTGELAVTGRREELVAEEDLAHPGQVDV